MTARLVHRGPDGEGYWSDPGHTACLGHRRLRVLDPSPRSDQPMVGAGGSVLVFNGEIYNFRELRRELEEDGRVFRTSGDTEVLSAALDRWGTDALGRLQGMFAFAAWDPGPRKLLLARDRLGVKPLFWARVRGGIAFASEIPALLAHHAVARDLDDDAVASWLQLGYLAGETTIVPGLHRLPPGRLLEADADGLRVRRWYDPLAEAAVVDTGQAQDALEGTILSAVEDRLVADVPLGCFLSGGVDSALVTAAAAAAGAWPRTLTIGFTGPFDESAAAARTAAGLRVESERRECSANRMLEVFDRWEDVAGDPLADPSLAPTWLVAAEARRRWTVALSGDGGDELFSGYPRLRLMPRLERWWHARSALRRAPLPPRRWAVKLRAATLAPTPEHAYQCLQGVWPGAEVARLLGQKELPLPWPQEVVSQVADQPPWRRWRLLDLLTFLPERVLAKVDRASMAHGLEVRVPLLDHRVVELALALPPGQVHNKRLLRSILGRHLSGPQPPRRKRGFEVPLAAWLRGPLGDPVRKAVLGPTAGELGLDRSVLEKSWDAHQSGRADHAERLFAVAVLSRWCRRWLG